LNINKLINISIVQTKDKIIEIFCIAEDFCKEFSQEIKKHQLKPNDGKKHCRRSL